MEQKKSSKGTKKDYEIVPMFSNSEKNIESAIQSAFLKYLKYNDYK